MARQLKFWNSSGSCCISKRKFPEEFKGSRCIHLFGCAYSKADLSRLISEFNGFDMNYTNEITKYFSESWGTSMEGITPERGLWIKWTDHGEVYRVL